jgi:hypothetical protein
MRAKIVSKVVTLPRSSVPESKIIQPLRQGNVNLTVAQTLSIRLGNQITANPSAHWGMSARRNRNSAPIKMREPTNAEKAYAFMHIPKGADRPPPPSNLRVVDIEDWDGRIFKTMSTWVRKRVKATYLAEK